MGVAEESCRAVEEAHILLWAAEMPRARPIDRRLAMSNRAVRWSRTAVDWISSGNSDENCSLLNKLEND